MSTRRTRAPSARSTPAAGDVLVDGRLCNVVPASDRGLAYGDGLFETIRFVAGVSPLWPLHLARLRRGCARLRLALPEPALLQDEARRLAAGEDVVIKLVLTGGDGRGYGRAEGTVTRRVLSRHPLPVMAATSYRDGVRLRWCRLRLSSQPALAGLKHLNRLENVLARSEWRDPRILEGLLCAEDDSVISATAANLFIVRDGQLMTPKLDRCGVSGVARAWILRRAARLLPVIETDLSRDDVLGADEVFLSNAVRGIVPVQRLGDHRFPVGSVTRRLGYTLASLGIGQPPGSAQYDEFD